MPKTQSRSDMIVAGRLKKLREKFSWSQETVASYSGGKLDRNYVSKIEIGHNKASSYEVRASLAIAFGVALSTISDYLDGRIDADAVYAEAKQRGLGAESDLETLRRDFDQARVAAGLASTDQATSGPAAEIRVKAYERLKETSRAWLKEALSDLDRRFGESDFADAAKVIEAVGGVWRTDAGRDAAVLALAMKLREERLSDRFGEFYALRKFAEYGASTPL